VSHPVVLDHPESGRKCMYVNDSFTRCLDGIDYRESRAMLAFLNDRLRRREFMVNHAWEPLGLAVWDNRSTQHYAVADDWPHRRVNRRVTFNAPGTERADRTERSVNSKALQGGSARLRRRPGGRAMHRAVQSYTDGFKRDAVRLATAPDNPVAGVAKDPDAGRTILTEWVTFNGSTQQRRLVQP
jgi:hypothetical protein